MLNGHRIGGLLLMGGIGHRFGGETPKQFLRLAGKMVFLHALEAFLSSGVFDEIVLSCHPQWIDAVRSMLPPAVCPIRLASGGATRQESSYNGLLEFAEPPDVVVIHDAVRPFVSQKILIQNAEQAIRTGAADTCIPSADTLVHAPDRRTIAAIPLRSEYLRGQTPQSFSYSLILSAHRRTKRCDCSDDCQLVLDMGRKVAVVEGDEHNLKITSGLDLFLAEQLLRLRCMDRKPAKDGSLSHQQYVIIGGKGGIGSAIEKKITDLHGSVLAVSRQTAPVRLDLNDPASIENAFREIHARFGPIDGLINCAGHLSVGPLDQLSFSEIAAAIDVNLKGMILCCKMAHLKQGARVINIASSSFSRGRKEISVYSAAKAGVVNFTQGWAEERPDLYVHAIIPQRTNTAMRRMNFPNEDARTLLEPETIADAVIDLLFQDGLSGTLVDVRKT